MGQHLSDSTPSIFRYPARAEIWHGRARVLCGTSLQEAGVGYDAALVLYEPSLAGGSDDPASDALVPPVVETVVADELQGVSAILEERSEDEKGDLQHVAQKEEGEEAEPTPNSVGIGQIEGGRQPPPRSIKDGARAAGPLGNSARGGAAVCCRLWCSDGISSASAPFGAGLVLK